MTVGITMLKILSGHEIEACCIFKKIENVKEVYRISGEYNLFLVMVTDNKTALYRLINSIKEDPLVTGIWHLLISEENDPYKDEASYLNWLKAHSKICIC